MEIGIRIKYYREEKGLTQKQLAQLVGVVSSMISMWENNINEPKASNVKKLAEVFEVSADELLGVGEFILKD